MIYDVKNKKNYKRIIKEQNMDEHVLKVTFLDEDEFKLESQIFTVKANGVEEAYTILDEEILNSNILYPSDNYETELIDVH